ncbi:MAG: hypothetical protein ACE5GM_02965 [bacterium]
MRYWLRYLLMSGLIFSLGCSRLDNLMGKLEEEVTILTYSNQPLLNRFPVYVKFTPDAGNVSFHMSQTENKTIAVLPVRSGMGGGGSEEVVTVYINSAFKKIVKGVTLITDKQADRLFTDMDLWDDYFAFIAPYTRKGITGGEDLADIDRLYSAIKADYIITVTSDYRFHSIGGLYPRAFFLYINLQIWDIKNKQKVWGGICNGETKALAAQDENRVTHETADRAAQRVFYELVKYL